MSGSSPAAPRNAALMPAAAIRPDRPETFRLALECPALRVASPPVRFPKGGLKGAPAAPAAAGRDKVGRTGSPYSPFARARVRQVTFRIAQGGVADFARGGPACASD